MNLDQTLPFQSTCLGNGQSAYILPLADIRSKYNILADIMSEYNILADIRSKYNILADKTSEFNILAGIMSK